jgi:hypothetical protein
MTDHIPMKGREGKEKAQEVATMFYFLYILIGKSRKAT